MTLTNQQAIQQIAETLGLPSELRSGKRDCWIKTTTLNGCWFELEVIKKGRIWRCLVEYNNSENQEVILNELPELEPALQGGSVVFNCADAEELLEVATQVRDFIVAKGLTRENGRKLRKTEDQGYFEKTAAIIKMAVGLQHWDILERGGLGFDAHDGLITIGKSQAVITNPESPTWREHIVPCVMIKEEAIRMAEAGNSVTEIAQMLKENLAIVIITAEEAKKIDSVYQTTMPNGWNFGHSVFARLDAMGIDY